ncbi:MAG: hypothetical protein WAM09_01005 [Anaerolineales bacterium]
MRRSIASVFRAIQGAIFATLGRRSLSVAVASVFRAIKEHSLAS